jgi:hypothetical protein
VTSSPSADLGLALICVPRVPVENTEDYRSSFHNLRILRKFLFARTQAVFLRKSRAIPFSATACERYFSREISTFFTEQESSQKSK